MLASLTAQHTEVGRNSLMTLISEILVLVLQLIVSHHLPSSQKLPAKNASLHARAYEGKPTLRRGARWNWMQI